MTTGGQIEKKNMQIEAIHDDDTHQIQDPCYGSLIWRTKLTQVQKLTCLCITGAKKSPPRAAMKTILVLPGYLD